MEPLIGLIADDKEPFSTMVWKISRVAFPAILTMVFSLMIDLVNMLFIAHTDDSAKMAGIGLGNMFVNIISQSVILGINGGISTLAS